MASIDYDRWKRLLSEHALTLGFFASALITWPILTANEGFERFYYFTRAHEDMELDELALLFVNLTIALMLSVFFQKKRLKGMLAERDAQHRLTEKIARHDSLTGLMNRHALTERIETIEQGACDGRSRTFAMVDLDRFKPVNDLHGHAAGDATLREVANRLREKLAPDCDLARLGGDEFAIIFPKSLSVLQVERLVRQVIHCIEQTISFETMHISISCSVGLVKWSHDLPGSEILRRSDIALYTAKTTGRGRFAWYDADLDQKAKERAAIEGDLRAAIEGDEIKPFFQPIIEIGTNRLVSLEVLARWHHPEHGPIPPDVFIEIAEDCGQIGNLGMSILHQACRAARLWDPGLSISVNLSPHQFHDTRLIDRIKEALVDCDFDPTRLILEVTENAVIHNIAQAREKLCELKELGITVALDDFGTGFSSLASLQQLPFDRLKVDRSFVTNIAQVPQNQRIFSGIMEIAGGLDLEVTAEGIETLQDLEYLGAAECALGQGFLFEKAVPAEQISMLLETKWSDRRIEPAGIDAVHAPDDTGIIRDQARLVGGAATA